MDLLFWLVKVGNATIDGAAGATVSMVSVWVVALDTPPSESVALAVIVLVPFIVRANVPEDGVAVLVFTDQVPDATVVV